MTNEEAKTLVNTKYKLYKTYKRKNTLSNIEKTIGINVPIQIGTLVINIACFNKFENMPGLILHLFAFMVAYPLSLKAIKHFTECTFEEFYMLKELKFELKDGKNRFKDINVEAFEEEFSELVYNLENNDIKVKTLLRIK